MCKLRQQKQEKQLGMLKAVRLAFSPQGRQGSEQSCFESFKGSARKGRGFGAYKQRM